MIKRYVFGNPIDTEAILNKPLPSSWGNGDINSSFKADNSNITYPLSDNDIVYGLGENVRGINKRGFQYVSYCTDDPIHTEDKSSLYGAHNFILINSPTAVPHNVGIFVDTPGRVTFDIGFTDRNVINITIDAGAYDLYVISPDQNIENVSNDSVTTASNLDFSAIDTPDSVVSAFRKLIGKSYIPPKWGFGYAQSRWGYKSSEDFRNIYKQYKELELPLDAIYVDIDYMERYKDFTINREAFPDFENLVKELSDKDVHLVPIIDGGVKIEKGYETYEEGVANNYFCKDENGDDFVVGVWPGDCHFPDMLNEEARSWFGHKYKYLLDMGIRGFWNDMNEPAIFYSRKNLAKVFEKIEEYKDINLDLHTFWDFVGLVDGVNNNREDYKSFYHNYHGQKVLHDDVHNLFGYFMTRGTYEAFEDMIKDERILMISRASYIGMHRYGGIWTGDNSSIWSHLLLNLKMMPSLNMCGFLYTGADMGGFGCNTTEDLLLRWTALSMFTPLMRNHSALGTREQEFYQFKDSTPLFKNLLTARYRLVPYLYSEFLKAVRDDSMMFRPLGFEYSDDSIAREIEDQMLIGNEIMIAPVVLQNTTGRVVYFPETMREIRFEDCKIVEGDIFEKGYHYIEIPLGVSNLFIRNGYEIPLGDLVDSIAKVDSKNISMYSCNEVTHSYELLDD